MDDTIVEYKSAYIEQIKINPTIKFPQSVPNFFANLVPKAGAIKAVNSLRSDPRFDIYILTAPSVRNPYCYMEKRLWVEKYFDLELCQKLIICPHKGLLKGDLLIDDYDHGKGQEYFQGVLLHFGSENFDNWQTTLQAIEILECTRNWSGGIINAFNWYCNTIIQPLGEKTAMQLVREGCGQAVIDILTQITKGGYTWCVSTQT